MLVQNSFALSEHQEYRYQHYLFNFSLLFNPITTPPRSRVTNNRRC
jgi:hypothetical protein